MSQRFTTAIRTGILLSGGETIIIGGSDMLWFYINGYLILELINTNSNLCASIDMDKPNNGIYLVVISEILRYYLGSN